ncbi:MAG: hypothetical protein WDO17_18185 [Alphaproteobacteria bacterium]
MEASPPRSFPFGTILLLAAAGVLYVAMLGTISFSSGGGEAAFGQALASLFATIGLWIALALLLVAGAMMGEMPRWAGFVAVFLVPLSGVATFTAIDMCSRHIKWAVVFPMVLPLLIAGYALWLRLPRLRAAVSAERISTVAWTLALALSVGALLAASMI